MVPLSSAVGDLFFSIMAAARETLACRQTTRVAQTRWSQKRGDVQRFIDFGGVPTKMRGETDVNSLIRLSVARARDGVLVTSCNALDIAH